MSKYMDSNKPYGDNSRKGAVRNRSQVRNTKTGRWVKRYVSTGNFLNQKSDRKPFKGVREEK